MRLWSIESLVVACVALIAASELSEAMLLLPLVIRRAAARRSLGERLINEIKEIDFPTLRSLPLQRRRSTSGAEPSRERLSHEAAASEVKTVLLGSDRRATMRSGAGPRKSNANLVGPSPKGMPKVDLFGDADWPPGSPRPPRNCEPRMMAGLSGIRVLSKLAECLDGGGGGDGDDRHAGTNWKLEGPIADYEDFYLKKKPEAQKFTAKFERMLDEWLVAQDKARAAADVRTG